MKYNKIFKTPEIITHQYLTSFLTEVEPLFRMNGARMRGVLFDTTNTKRIDILGLLLLYKFFEYSIQKSCLQNPECTLHSCKNLLREIDRSGFKPMIQQFLNDKIPEDYSMAYKESDGVFIAPMTLNRGQSRETTEVSYRSKISEYYSYNKKISFVILQCLGEIASNFSEHAVADTKSILVASGNRSYFEIACADNGEGIVSTLGPVMDKHNLEGFSIIQHALCRGVSSKLDSGHMGCGLWLIDKFVEATKGELCIYSEGGYVYKRTKRVDKGKSPYWKGTIIYLRIPLEKPDLLHNVIEELKVQYCKNRIQKI